MERRPELLSSVMLRQNPHNVHEWHKRVKLFEGNAHRQIVTFTEAVTTVDPNQVPPSTPNPRAQARCPKAILLCRSMPHCRSCKRVLDQDEHRVGCLAPPHLGCRMPVSGAFCSADQSHVSM